MFRPQESTPSRAVLTVVRVGLVVFALVGVTAIYVPVASAARWPQKHLTAAPVSSAQISAQLKAVTGYTSSQLTATPVCGTPAPGTFGCLADVLTITGTNDRVGPRSAPHSRPNETTTRRRAPGAPTPAAVSAPQALTPADVQWAYDLTALSATAGATDTVAIVDAYDDPKVFTDLTHYRMAYGLAPLPLCDASATPPVTTSCFQEVNQSGGTALPSTPSSANAGWNVEESLDVEAVSSLCPLCKILVVEANSDSDSDLQAAAHEAANLGASQISMSFGSDEPVSYEPSEASGWSFGSASPIAAVGDGSYPGPPNYADNYYYWDYQKTAAPYAAYPAALPNVTAVGGSSLSLATNTRGFAESTWAITTPCTFTWSASGTSHCSGTESGCDTSQATPLYQQQNSAMIAACSSLAASVNTTSAGGRGYSDVSADADPNTGLTIYDTRPYPFGCGTSNNLCEAGGTSLATPLTAAFEAVTGTNGGTPAWAYGNDAADLNDIVSGSDGTCPSGATLLCNAGTGWDGPTGNGSISGDVVTGPPGIGGASETAGGTPTNPNATLSGGVYPNMLGTTNMPDTTYVWEYGTTAAYGSQTQPVDIGNNSTLASASGLLSGLTPCAIYHYRLDATNADGTTYGYDNTFTASQTAPSNTSAPTITGTAESDQVLTAGVGSWSPTACGTPLVSYQWQESANSTFSTFTNIGANASTYTPVDSDGGMYIRVVVTESNSGGSSQPAPSQPVGPVVGSNVFGTGTDTGTGTTSTPNTTTTPPQTVTTITQTTTTGGNSTTTVQFYRCAHTCTLINTRGATTYKLEPADNGMYIELKVTTKTPGQQPIVTVRWIGPVTAPTAGNATIASAARVASTLSIRGTKNAVLAHVQVTKRTGKAVTLAITPQGKVRTRIRAYVVSNGDVVSCTVTRTLLRKLKLTVPLKKGQSVKLVAVRAS